MPINVTGTTDTSNALSALGIASKVVCVVGVAGIGSTATPLTPFNIAGIADAREKFGADTKAEKLVAVLIDNGVAIIKGVVVPEVGAPYVDKASAYDAVFDVLLQDRTTKVVIVDDVDQTVHDKLASHMDLAESEDIFRYGVIGTDITTNTGLSAVATALNNKRMFCPGPSLLDKNGNTLSGIYAAAGLAALIATETNDPALPMNGVELSGFYGIDRVLLNADRTALVTAGIVPLVMSKDGKPSVYRLVTTRTKDAENNVEIIWQEGTTVFIADDVLESVQQRIRNNYKRTKNVARILKAIRTDVVDVLQGKNDLEIIENFDPKTVSVTKDPYDIYGALIDYEFDVVTPLYNVTIKQHMKL